MQKVASDNAHIYQSDKKSKKIKKTEEINIKNGGCPPFLQFGFYMRNEKVCVPQESSFFISPSQQSEKPPKASSSLAGR
ncbi:MAG: hypothetical protein EGQ30_02305 [Clostridiales bacterium]|nr:hypothetical protein [Clostridiales bacterium]